MKLIKCLIITLWLSARYVREINAVLSLEGELKFLGVDRTGINVWVQSQSGLCVEFHSETGFKLESHSVEFHSEQARSELRSLPLDDHPITASDPEVLELLEDTQVVTVPGG